MHIDQFIIFTDIELNEIKCDSEDLKGMNKLVETMHIKGLKSIRDSDEAKQTGLDEKSGLMRAVLIFS